METSTLPIPGIAWHTLPYQTAPINLNSIINTKCFGTKVDDLTIPCTERLKSVTINWRNFYQTKPDLKTSENTQSTVYT